MNSPDVADTTLNENAGTLFAGLGDTVGLEKGDELGDVLGDGLEYGVGDVLGLGVGVGLGDGLRSTMPSKRTLTTESIGIPGLTGWYETRRKVR